MKIELEIDDSLYHECKRRNIDIPSFCVGVLWCYVNNINGNNGNNGGKINYLELKEDFSKWLLQRVSRETAKKYLRLLDGFTVFDRDSIKRNYDQTPDKRNYAKAVRNFLNYLNEIDVLSRDEVEKLKRLVPIPKTKPDNSVPSDQDIKEAFCYFSAMRKDLYTAARILLYSGARARHVVKMINEFDEKKLTVLDGFARYNINVDNNTKKAYYIYFPANLIDDIRDSNVTVNAVRCDLNYMTTSRRVVSAKYIRKWFNNILVRMKVDRSVRNFILSRSSEIHKSVEADHYLELTALADEVYPKIVEEIRKRIKI